MADNQIAYGQVTKVTLFDSNDAISGFALRLGSMHRAAPTTNPPLPYYSASAALGADARFLSPVPRFCRQRNRLY